MSTPQIKATLIKLAMRTASAARISPRAQALLAHLVAESWPTDGAWITTRTNPQLIAALSCSEDSVRRAIRELERAEIVRRRTGRGHIRSRFVITLAELREVAPVQPQPPHPCNLGGRTPATSEVAPVRPPLNTSRIRSEASPPGDDEGERGSVPLALDRLPRATEPAGGAAAIPTAADQERTPMPTPPEVLAAIIATRPTWMPDDKPWIDEPTSHELARRPGVSIDVVHWAIKLTRERRKTLGNPAGYCISKIRQPDAADVARTAARARRQSAIAQHSADAERLAIARGQSALSAMSESERAEIRAMFDQRRTRREISDARAASA